MKKINIKKLNQFFMSGNNSAEIKSLVNVAVENFTTRNMAGEGVPNVQYIAILTDLGLLMDA